MKGLSFTSRIGGSEAGLGPERPTRPVTSPTARSLSLAHYIEDAVEKGVYRSAAEVAAALGVTRARVSQVGKLLRLDPSTQKMSSSAVTPARLGHCGRSALRLRG